MFATALALVLSALNVYLRDVQHLVEILLLVLFWASPIVYSVGFVHDAIGGTWLEELYLANPVTLGVLGMQKAMWVSGIRGPDAVLARVPLAPDAHRHRRRAACCCSIAQRIFSRLQSNFAQEL